MPNTRKFPLSKDSRSKPTVIQQSTSKQFIDRKFLKFQENNPKLQHLINKFSTDPTRKLKSVMITNTKLMENKAKGTKGRPQKPQEYNRGEFRSTILVNRKDNGQEKKPKNERAQFMSVFNGKQFDGAGQKKFKKPNFIHQNRKNAFNVTRNTGFFGSKLLDYKAK